MTRPAPPRRARRRGFSLVEMAAAGVLFATMATLAMQVIGWAGVERRSAARREAAARAAGNLMERILARPWADLDAATLAPLARDATASAATGGGAFRVEVIPAPAIDGRGQRRIVVEVAWPDGPGRARAPVRLVGWSIEPRGARP